MYIVRFPYLQICKKTYTATGRNKKVLLYIVALQTKQESSSDILQGQALFIRVEQEILFDFWTADRDSDRQKRQTLRKKRQAQMTDRHKDWQKNRKDRSAIPDMQRKLNQSLMEQRKLMNNIVTSEL